MLIKVRAKSLQLVEFKILVREAATLTLLEVERINFKSHHLFCALSFEPSHLRASWTMPQRSTNWLYYHPPSRTPKNSQIGRAHV